MKCFQCGRGPSDGITVYRQNAKGETGIWACEKHTKPIEVGLAVDVAIIEAKIGSTKQ